MQTDIATGAGVDAFLRVQPQHSEDARRDVSPVRGELIRAAGTRDQRFRIVDGRGAPLAENRQRRPAAGQVEELARRRSRARARQPVGRVSILAGQIQADRLSLVGGRIERNARVRYRRRRTRHLRDSAGPLDVRRGVAGSGRRPRRGLYRHLRGREIGRGGLPLSARQYGGVRGRLLLNRRRHDRGGRRRGGRSPGAGSRQGQACFAPPPASAARFWRRWPALRAARTRDRAARSRRLRARLRTRGRPAHTV